MRLILQHRRAVGTWNRIWHIDVETAFHFRFLNFSPIFKCCPTSNSEILFFATFSFKITSYNPHQQANDTPSNVSAGIHLPAHVFVHFTAQPMATRGSHRSCSRWRTRSYTSQLVAVILAVQKSQQSRPASGHTNVRKSNGL